MNQLFLNPEAEGQGSLQMMSCVGRRGVASLLPGWGLFVSLGKETPLKHGGMEETEVSVVLVFLLRASLGLLLPRGVKDSCFTQEESSKRGGEEGADSILFDSIFSSGYSVPPCFKGFASTLDESMCDRDFSAKPFPI
jgi:hypothetical protein